MSDFTLKLDDFAAYGLDDDFSLASVASRTLWSIGAVPSRCLPQQSTRRPFDALPEALADGLLKRINGGSATGSKSSCAPVPQQKLQQEQRWQQQAQEQEQQSQQEEQQQQRQQLQPRPQQPEDVIIKDFLERLHEQRPQGQAHVQDPAAPSSSVNADPAAADPSAGAGAIASTRTTSRFGFAADRDVDRDRDELDREDNVDAHLERNENGSDHVSDIYTGAHAIDSEAEREDFEFDREEYERQVEEARYAECNPWPVPVGVESPSHAASDHDDDDELGAPECGDGNAHRSLLKALLFRNWDEALAVLDRHVHVHGAQDAELLFHFDREYEESVCLISP